MGNFYRVSRSPLAKIPVIKFFEKILGNAGIGWEFWLQTFLSWRANGLLSFAVEQIEVSHRTGGRESVVRTSFVLTSPNGAFQISRFPKNSKNSMQGKISHPPRRADSSSWGGAIILDNYIMNMTTCSKTLQVPVPVKNAS